MNRVKPTQLFCEKIVFSFDINSLKIIKYTLLSKLMNPNAIYETELNLN